MMYLSDCLQGCRVIATIGICKNAGKTTVLNYLLSKYKDDYTVGITSIGYDGEERDQITLLPKPRIAVCRGMYVATCRSCLEKTDVLYEDVKRTGIMTAIGEVIIARMQGQGIVEVSGPSMASQVEAVCNDMLSMGCDKVIADGAAGRISYAALADCAILSVGAALSSSMHKTLIKAKHKVELLSLPKHMEDEHIVPEDAVYEVQQSDDGYVFYFRGVMADSDLLKIMSDYKHKRKTVVVRDATGIFVSPSILNRFANRKGKIEVLRRINLAAVTINPMSPYGKWYDKDEFLHKMKKALGENVFNIMDEEEIK